MIVPGHDSLASLCYGAGLGAVLYVASCLLLPGGLREAKNLLADFAALLPAGPLRAWRRDAR
jgi:hypothetical protein